MTLARVSDSVADQAIGWYVLLASGTVAAEQQQAFECWLAASDEHQLAWERLENMGVQFRQSRSRVPSTILRATLERATQEPSRRRQMLKVLALTGVGVGTLAGVPFYLGSRSDLHTAKGEQRRLQLDDGSQLVLNTDTRVDVDYSGHQRRLYLHHGELQVTVAADKRNRPLQVACPAAQIQALDSRFSLRLLEHEPLARVRVAEGAVMVEPRRAGQGMRLGGGRQVRFDARHLLAAEPLSAHGDAWIDGLLVAERMPLQAFLSELARYHRGYLGWSEALASLRLTGTFPLADTGAILTALEDSLPLRARRLTRYWTRLEPSTG